MSEATEQLGCDWSSSEFQGKQNPLSFDSKFNWLQYRHKFSFESEIFWNTLSGWLWLPRTNLLTWILKKINLVPGSFRKRSRLEWMPSFQIKLSPSRVIKCIGVCVRVSAVLCLSGSLERVFISSHGKEIKGSFLASPCWMLHGENVYGNPSENSWNQARHRMNQRN